MAFPKIEYCLICEDVRIEVRNKSTILGFYGVAPNVTILIKELNLPIGPLSFLLLTGVGFEGNAEAAVSIRISDNNGKVLVQLDARQVKVPPVPVGKRAQLIFKFNHITFQNPGIYTFILSADDTVAFQTSFIVEKGGPKDFPE